MLQKFLFTALFLVVTAVFSFAAGVAKITFVDGNVKIMRHAKLVSADLIEEGFELENYDTVTTGPKSQVEIKLNPNSGITGTLKLSPSTSFYLELSALKGEQVAGIELLAGSVAVKVGKMVGKSGLQVRTESTVMGVRGTQFHVLCSPGGDLLVTADEGRVECRNDNSSFFSEPGTVVEFLPTEKQFRPLPVPAATLLSYENQWREKRLAALRSNAPRALKFFALRYQQKFSEVSRSFDRLQEDGQKIITLWKSQDQEGTLSPPEKLLAEKRALVGLLMHVRQQIVLLERFYQRVLEIRQYAAEGALPADTELTRNYTAKDFFRQLDKDETTLQQWMGEYRYLMKLYSDRNEGSVPWNFQDQDFIKESDLFN